MPAAAAYMSKFTMPLLGWVLRKPVVKKCMEKIIDKNVKGPELSFRTKGYTEVWAKAVNAKGDVAEGYLRTGEVYHLTAQLSVRFIEHVLAKNPSGALAPAQIFPMRDLLAVDGVFLYNAAHTREIVA